MKKNKSIVILMTCLLSVVSSIGVCYAKGESTAVVSYTPSSDEIAPTDIKIIVSAKTSEFGSIYDEDTLLGVGENIYQLKHKETKIFRIQPAFGYDVEKVVYDKEDITSELRATRSIRKNYYIEIEGKGHDAELEVDFKKISTEEPENPETPDKPDEPDKPEVPENPSVPNEPAKPNTPSDTSTPSTGDETSTNGYIALVGITGFVIITLLYKKEEEER